MKLSVSYQVLRRFLVVGRHLKKVQLKCLSTAVSPRIEVSTDFALADEKIKITAHGLKSGQKVTLQAYFEESGKPFGSCGHYIADTDGKVDTFVDASHGGSYEGVEPMGLFSNSKSTPEVKPTRLMKADPMSPYNIIIAVQDGFHAFENLQWTYSLSSLASCRLQRTYAAPGVKSFPLHEDGLYGVLMVPPGEGPFPAVIDVFGFGSGIRGYRAALLASHGIAALHLAYVNHEDLPNNEMKLDFNYFLKAFDWLASHPLTDSNSLGGVGTCVGAGYLQFIASMRPAMKCLAIVNSPGMAIGPEQNVEGEDVTVQQFRYDRITLVDGMATFKTMFSLDDDVFNHKLCPSWRYGAKHLWISGLDDQCVNPDVIKVLKTAIPPQFRNNYTFLTYPGAGHLMEPPYSPLWRSNYLSIFKRTLLWGGQPALHAQAQEKSWPKILAFLHEYLGKMNK